MASFLLIVVAFVEVFFVVMILVLWSVSHTGPIFKHFLVLPSQFDVKPAGEDLAVVAVSDEVDSIDFHL